MAFAAPQEPVIISMPIWLDGLNSSTSSNVRGGLIYGYLHMCA